MLGTLLSLLFALFFYLQQPRIEASSARFFSLLLFFVAALFLLLHIAIAVFAWGPQQKTEQNLTPHLIRAFEKDRNRRLTSLFLVAFFLVSYLLVVDFFFLQTFYPLVSLIVWTIGFGVSVDLLLHQLKRTAEFLDPFHILEFFSKSARECIRGAKEAELCEWIDTFAESATKAATKHSSSIALIATEKLELLAKNYLEVAKGVTYHSDDNSARFGSADHVSYTLFYLFQRMELMFDKALEKKLEPLCSKMVTTLGKISIHGAKYDITLAGYPLYYLGKWTKKAQKTGLEEVANRSTLTLLEVSRVITHEVDLRYVDIKDPFLTIVDIMHEIAKETFRADKSTNIAMLVQPFRDLKELFQSEKMAEHQDSPPIVENIDNVLAEFANLEQVINTMPSPSDIIEEEKEEQGQKTEEKPEE